MNNNKLYFLIIGITGFFVFFNSLLNGFVFDDLWQIQNNTKIHSLQNIPSIFVGSTFGYFKGEEPQANLYYYYKPLMSVSFALIYSLFGATPFYFHLAQVLLHILNATLIFLLFSRFFQKKLSLFLSLIFLIHPINAEVVNYIATLQDVLFLLFGLFCLYFFIIKTESEAKFKKSYYIPIYLLLLASVLSKESGILFLIIIPFYALIFAKKRFIPSLFVSFCSLISYLYLRLFIGHVDFNPVRFLPIAEADFTTRLINIPKMILFYLQTFFFPKDIYFQPMWLVKATTLENFYIPLFLVIVFMIVVFSVGIITWKNKSLFKIYFFLLGWFLIGLIIHLNIIPLDGTVNNRWFYFPMVGLLGIFGIVFNKLVIKNNNLKISLSMIACIILIMLGFRTLVHNVNWYSTYSLASTDPDTNNYFIQQNLGIELFYQKRYSEAKRAFIRSTTLFPNSSALSSLGVIYMLEGNLKESEKYLYKAMKYDTLDAYQNLAYVLLKNHKPNEAKIILKKGLNISSNNSQLWIFLIFAEYQTGYMKEATQAAYKAYTLSPNSVNQKTYEQLKNNQPIDNLFK